MKKLVILLIPLLIFSGCRDVNQERYDELAAQIGNLSNEVDGLRESVQDTGEDDTDQVNNTLYYVAKLSDRDFIGTYGEGENMQTFYIAAEELGAIGRPALPFLIKNLQSRSTYERGLTLYAISLASQNDNVTEVTGGEGLDIGIDFDDTIQDDNIERVMEWWEQHRESL